jgi:hypothetical protein
MGPVTDDERNGLINHSPLYGKMAAPELPFLERYR